MQIALEADLAPPQVKKWHPLARVGFIVGFSAGCWTLIALGIRAAI